MPQRVESQILMSAHKFRIELTDLAREDFRDILSYTTKTWGSKQRVIYRDKINAALHMIASNPYSVRDRSDEVRIVPVAKHRIVYRVKNKVIAVLRILHERMDEGAHVGM